MHNFKCVIKAGFAFLLATILVVKPAIAIDGVKIKPFTGEQNFRNFHEQSTYHYDAFTSLVLVELSSAAYEIKSGQSNQENCSKLSNSVKTRASLHGWSGLGAATCATNLTVYNDTSAKANVQGFVLETQNAIFIVFKGTDSEDRDDSDLPVDWLFTNFNAVHTDFSVNGKRRGKVHSGFYGQATSFLNMLANNHTNQPNQNSHFSNISQSSKPIFLSGHSLGGAVATITAATLRERGVAKHKLQVYTFGSPSVGDREFAEFYASERAEGINMQRVRNKDDIVPYAAYINISEDILSTIRSSSAATTFNNCLRNKADFLCVLDLIQLGNNFWELMLDGVKSVFSGKTINFIRGTHIGMLRAHSADGLHICAVQSTLNPLSLSQLFPQHAMSLYQSFVATNDQLDLLSDRAGACKSTPTNLIAQGQCNAILSRQQLDNMFSRIDAAANEMDSLLSNAYGVIGDVTALTDISLEILGRNSYSFLAGPIFMAIDTTTFVQALFTDDTAKKWQSGQNLITSTASTSAGIAAYAGAAKAGPAGAAIVATKLVSDYVLEPYLWGKGDKFIDSAKNVIFYSYSIRDAAKCIISDVLIGPDSIQDKKKAIVNLTRLQEEEFSRLHAEVDSKYRETLHKPFFIFTDYLPPFFKVIPNPAYPLFNIPIKMAADNMFSSIETAQQDTEIWLNRAMGQLSQLEQKEISLAAKVEQLKALILAKRAGINAEGAAIYQLTTANPALTAWDAYENSAYFSENETFSFCFGHPHDPAKGALTEYRLWLENLDSGDNQVLTAANFNAATGCADFTSSSTGRFRLLFVGAAYAGANGSGVYIALTLKADSIALQGKATTPGGDNNGNPGIIATRPLNDTGIDWCANNSQNNLACPVPGFEGQDGEHGRDALARAGQLQKVGTGAAGFDFTKLDANGNDLPESATEWSCVRDNHTGLIWEVKSTEAGLQNVYNRYTWYDPDPNTNGGHHGLQGGSLGWNNTPTCIGSVCDTFSYVQKINELSLCGAGDWRLPTKNELLSIVNYGNLSMSLDALSVDAFYFPEPRTNSNYWTSSSDAFQTQTRYGLVFGYKSFVVNFRGGGSFTDSKTGHNHLRLVRSLQ